MTALKGIETTDGDVQVGQGHGHTGVAHVLRQVGGGADRHADT